MNTYVLDQFETLFHPAKEAATKPRRVSILARHATSSGLRLNLQLVAQEHNECGYELFAIATPWSIPRWKAKHTTSNDRSIGHSQFRRDYQSYLTTIANHFGTASLLYSAIKPAPIDGDGNPMPTYDEARGLQFGAYPWWPNGPWEEDILPDGVTTREPRITGRVQLDQYDPMPIQTTAVQLAKTISYKWLDVTIKEDATKTYRVKTMYQPGQYPEQSL